MDKGKIANVGRYLLGAVLASLGFTGADIYTNPTGAVKNEAAVVLENINKIDEIQVDVKAIRAKLEGVGDELESEGK